jgi:hypothetical protein
VVSLGAMRALPVAVAVSSREKIPAQGKNLKRISAPGRCDRRHGA